MLPWLVAALLTMPQGPVKKGTTETAHLVITTSVSAASAAPDGKITLYVDVAPKPRMHVYSPGQEGYIAVALTLDADAPATLAKAQYPAGEKLFMPLLNETQLVYSKPFRITQDVTLKSSAPPVRIKGTLRYQACDDKVCYLPKNVPVEWTLNR
jgi:DsbC/DsbD-like thiol-disulfide interchange protein